MRQLAQQLTGQPDFFEELALFFAGEHDRSLPPRLDNALPQIDDLVEHVIGTKRAEMVNILGGLVRHKASRKKRERAKTLMTRASKQSSAN
jgi:hypothetical protein